MDPFPVRDREYPMDPYYASVNLHIHSIKVVPVIDQDAKVFPSWVERKLVWLELIFSPFTLETVVVFHDGQDIDIKPGQPREKGKLDAVVICSSYFIPIMDFGTQRHIELFRVEDVQGKILAFRESPSQIPSMTSLTSKIAGRTLDAIMAVGKEINPSLELCFENNDDAKAFIHAWSLAFGRKVDQVQLRKGRDILRLSNNKTHPPPLVAIPRSNMGTPVSLQNPTNASSLILPSLIYERSLVSTESKNSINEPGLCNLPCHHYGGASSKGQYAMEVYIPFRKLLKCQIPKYPKIDWWVEVTSASDSGIPDNGITPILNMRIEDSSIRMLCEPLLPLRERQIYLENLAQEGKIEEWNQKKKESYWWLRLSCHHTVSRAQRQLGRINIKFPPIPEICALYRQPMYNANQFSSRNPTSFIIENARVIEAVFLGHRLGRQLPDLVLQRINFLPPIALLTEQADAFSHVLDHDFTVVDGAPGTGKSKVTTDIILGFLSAGMQVLVITTSETALEFLASSILSSLPQNDIRVTEAIAKLRLWSRGDPSAFSVNGEPILESVNVGVTFSRVKKYPYIPVSRSAWEIETRKRLQRARLIFMTTGMAERLDSYYGIHGRTYDLIVLDEANTCNESLGLQLTQSRFANAFRWLVIGCSKGISPGVNIDEFKGTEACGSWFTRLLRHPEFRINPLRLTKQSRMRKALYEPINSMFFNSTITTTSDAPQEEGEHKLCMGFVNTARICKPKAHDEEILEMIDYRREQSYTFIIAQKIHKLSPNSSIVVICYTESQKALMYAELGKIKDLRNATIDIQIIDEFANKEVDYAIIHVPLWRNSYSYTDDPGRFLIAMTRAKKAVFAVGNLNNLAKFESKRGTWANNPWRTWVMEVNKSLHGAVFEDVAEINLVIEARELATFKKGKVQLVGQWLGGTKEERAKLIRFGSNPRYYL